MSNFYKRSVDQKQIYSKCIETHKKMITNMKNIIPYKLNNRYMSLEQQKNYLLLCATQINSLFFDFENNNNELQFQKQYCQIYQIMKKIISPQNKNAKMELLLKILIFACKKKITSEKILNQLMRHQLSIIKYFQQLNDAAFINLLRNYEINHLLNYWSKKNSVLISQYGQQCFKIYRKVNIIKKSKNIILPSQKETIKILRKIVEKTIMGQLQKTNENQKPIILQKILNLQNNFIEQLSKETIQILRQYEINKQLKSSNSSNVLTSLIKKKTKENTIKSNSISRSSNSNLLKNVPRISIVKKNSKVMKRLSHQFDFQRVIPSKHQYNNTLIELNDIKSSEVKEQQQSESNISIDTSQIIQSEIKIINTKKIKKSFCAAASQNKKFIYSYIEQNLEIMKIQKFVLRSNIQKNQYLLYSKLQHPKINCCHKIAISKAQYENLNNLNPSTSNNLILFDQIVRNSLKSYIKINKTILGFKIMNSNQKAINHKNLKHFKKVISIRNDFNTYFFQVLKAAQNLISSKIFNMTFNILHQEVIIDKNQKYKENTNFNDIIQKKSSQPIFQNEFQTNITVSIYHKQKQDKLIKCNKLIKGKSNKTNTLQIKKNEIEQQTFLTLNKIILININHRLFTFKMKRIKENNNDEQQNELQFELKEINNKFRTYILCIQKSQIQKIIRNAIIESTKLQKFITNFVFVKCHNYSRLIKKSLTSFNLSSIKKYTQKQLVSVQKYHIIHKYLQKINSKFIIVYILYHKWVEKISVRIYHQFQQLYYEAQFDWNDIIFNANMWMFANVEFSYFLQSSQSLKILINELKGNIEISLGDIYYAKIFELKSEMKIILFEKIFKEQSNNEIIGQKMYLDGKEFKILNKDIFYHPKLQLVEFSYEKITKYSKKYLEITSAEILKYFEKCKQNSQSKKMKIQSKYLLISLSDIMQISKIKINTLKKQIQTSFFKYIGKSFYKIVIKRKHLQIFSAQNKLMGKISLNDINKKIPFFNELLTLKNNQIFRQRISLSLKVAFPLLYL